MQLHIIIMLCTANMDATGGRLVHHVELRGHPGDRAASPGRLYSRREPLWLLPSLDGRPWQRRRGQFDPDAAVTGCSGHAARTAKAMLVFWDESHCWRTSVDPATRHTTTPAALQCAVVHTDRGERLRDEPRRCVCSKQRHLSNNGYNGVVLTMT
jgi:hypothetical protein